MRLYLRFAALSCLPNSHLYIVLMQTLFQNYINAISAASMVSSIDLSSVRRFDVAAPVKVEAALVLELGSDGFVALA